jgi:ribosomal protein S12 methylthiotransferase accessory factor
MASAPTAPRTAATKRFRTGTHRLIPPEETLARLRPLLPAMGITRIANVTGLDTLGIPVVMVCRPNSRSLSVSQGKGLDLAAAKASGVMESVELFHAERVAAPLLLGSLRELRDSRPLIELAGLPRLSVSGFHDALQLLWCEGFDLVGGGRVWLPFELVHMNYTVPLPPGSGSFLMSSRGLASGNHPLEAVSHGLCELVEHDAATLWRHREEGARARTRLDLDTVDDAGCRELLERYARAGIEVAVWESTSDIGLASFVCTIDEREPDPARPIPPMTGMGCHPAREVALMRALTEAAQSRLTFIAGSRDDVLHGAYASGRDADGLRHWRARTRGERPTRHFHEAPTFHGETFEEDVDWELKRLVAAGLTQVVAVDLSRPEFRIAVSRVVIPGLEPLADTPGYIPGPRARRMRERGA